MRAVAPGLGVREGDDDPRRQQPQLHVLAQKQRLLGSDEREVLLEIEVDHQIGDPPYGVVLENGRMKAGLARFDESEPEASLRKLLLSDVLSVLHCEPVGLPQREVAGGVLVEQRVVEQQARLCDR